MPIGVMRFRFILGLIVGLALFTGCARTDAPSDVLTGSLDQPYLLDSGDRVRIVVFGQDNLTSAYTVDGGGHIAFPLIGAVNARGRTTRQLEQSIAGALGRNYLKDPNVTVQIEAHRPFFILGEVRTPGQYPYVSGMTVQTAVAIAGGYTPRAVQDSAEITRQTESKTLHGIVKPTQAVRPGDTINVRERFF